MRFADLSLLLGVVTCMGIGQILFKFAARAAPSTLDGFLDFSASMKFLLIAGAGIALYGLTSVAWILALRNVDLSRAYPIAALSFVVVPVLSIFVFQERIAPAAWGGMALILIGIWVVARS